MHYDKVIPRLYPKLEAEGPEGKLNILRAMIADNR